MTLTDPPGFLARWSRRKLAGQRKPPRPETAAAGEVTAQRPNAEPEASVEGLPPIDSLTGDSDFTAFMRPGVPEALRNRALRKLWGSDPVYANLDGLLEYGEDFAEPFRFAGTVATVYRILEGMPDPESAQPEAAPPERQSPEDSATTMPDETAASQVEHSLSKGIV